MTHNLLKLTQRVLTAYESDDGFSTAVAMDELRTAIREIIQLQVEKSHDIKWAIWWGVGDMRLHNRLFDTEAEAKKEAACIKSNTKVERFHIDSSCKTLTERSRIIDLIEDRIVHHNGPHVLTLELNQLVKVIKSDLSWKDYERSQR